MTTLKPGSMLLGTTRPAELRAWYIKALAPEPSMLAMARNALTAAQCRPQ